VRYGSKRDLLDSITGEHDALRKLLDAIPASRYTEDGVWGDGWTVSDLVAHLAEWHSMFLRWFHDGQRGESPDLPAPGYKWSETPRLNRAIREKHSARPFADVEAEFEATYREILQLVGGLSEAALLEPGRFRWTGSNALVTYIGPNTASHYRFAQRVLQRWQRSAASHGRTNRSSSATDEAG
jgi:hypothetical protein